MNRNEAQGVATNGAGRWKVYDVYGMIAVLNLKTQTCCEALSFTCAKRCMKPTKAQRCQNIELSRLSEANIPGKGNKIRMA